MSPNKTQKAVLPWLLELLHFDHSVYQRNFIFNLLKKKKKKKIQQQQQQNLYASFLLPNKENFYTEYLSVLLNKYKATQVTSTQCELPVSSPLTTSWICLPCNICHVCHATKGSADHSWVWRSCLTYRTQDWVCAS